MASAEDLKQRGNEAFTSGCYEEAEQLYSQALQLDASSHVLFSNRSAARLKLNRLADALADAEACTHLQPAFPKGYSRKAAALELQGRPGLAEAALRAGALACSGDKAAAEALQRELRRMAAEDDPDQDPLRGVFPGSPAQNMRDLQGQEGLAMTPAAVPEGALRAALLGAAAEFERLLDPGAGHLRARVQRTKIPLASLVVCGAQRAEGQGSDHARCLRIALEAGARVDARDAAGYTALAHATGHHAELGLAQILLEHGADVNAKDRFGTVPLHHAIMGGERDAVKLLLDQGADPRQEDNHGVSVESVARCDPLVLQMVQAALNKNQEGGEAAPKGPCAHCGRKGAKQRCTGCQLALYCNGECQRAGWQAHRAECKAGAAAALRVPIHNPEGLHTSTISISSMMDQMMAGIGGRRAPAGGLQAHQREMGGRVRGPSGTFTVKVQVPLQPLPADHPQNMMLVYNKKRDFMQYVRCHASEATQELEALVRRRGVNRNKAYMVATFDEAAQELVLAAGKLLPVQPW